MGGMSNVLSQHKREMVVALGRLGWSLRRIEQETGVRRETVSGYLKAAGVAVGRPKPASNPSPDPAGCSGVEPPSSGGLGPNPATNPSPDSPTPNPATNPSPDLGAGALRARASPSAS